MNIRPLRPRVSMEKYRGALSAASGGGGGTAFPAIAGLVASMEAQELSGLSNGAAVTSIADPHVPGNSWSTVAGTVTKETFRGKTVLHLGAGGIVEAVADFDSSFDTALTVVYVGWQDAQGPSGVVVSNGTAGLLAELAIYEHSILTDRVTGWFGVSGSVSFTDGRYNPGQVAGYRYDGANVKVSRNKKTGDLIAKTGNLGLSGAVRLGAASSGFVGNLRSVYIFNRAITDGELASLVDYCCARSTNFVGNNTYLFAGDSQTGDSGGSLSYWSTIKDRMDAAGVVYNYLKTSANVGRAMSDYLDTPDIFEDEVDHRISDPSNSEHETVIIWIGTNDLRSYGISSALAITRINSLISEFTARGATRFVLVGCLPIQDETEPSLTKAAEYNAHLASLDNTAGANTIKYVPIQEHPDLATWSSSFYGDSTHLNNAGKLIVADLVYDALIPWNAVAPVNLTAPTVTPPTPSNGGTISIIHGTYDNYPSSYTYKWFADGVEIPGETGQTYEPAGHANGVLITASEAGVNAYGSSAATVSSNAATITAFTYLENQDFTAAGAPAGWGGSASYPGAVAVVGAGQTAQLTIPSGPHTILCFRFKIKVTTNGGATGSIFDITNNFFSQVFALYLSSSGTLTMDFGTFTSDALSTGTDYHMWIYFNGSTVEVSFDAVGNPRPTSGSKFLSAGASPSMYLARWITAAGHAIEIDDVKIAASSIP